MKRLKSLMNCSEWFYFTKGDTGMTDGSDETSTRVVKGMKETLVYSVKQQRASVSDMPRSRT